LPDEDDPSPDEIQDIARQLIENKPGNIMMNQINTFCNMSVMVIETRVI